MERYGETEFEGRRLKRSGLVGVAFVADWCGYCRRFMPVYEAFVSRAPFPLALADASDDEGPFWDQVGLDVVPTLVLYREGEEIWRKGGVLSVGLHAKDVEAMIEASGDAV